MASWLSPRVRPSSVGGKAGMKLHGSRWTYLVLALGLPGCCSLHNLGGRDDCGCQTNHKCLLKKWLDRDRDRDACCPCECQMLCQGCGTPLGCGQPTPLGCGQPTPLGCGQPTPVGCGQPAPQGCGQPSPVPPAHPKCNPVAPFTTSPPPPPPYEAPPAPINQPTAPAPPSQPPHVPYQKPPQAVEPQAVPPAPGTDVPLDPVSSSINWRPNTRRPPQLISYEEFQRLPGKIIARETQGTGPTTISPSAVPAHHLAPVPAPSPTGSAQTRTVPPIVIQPGEFAPPLQVE